MAEESNSGAISGASQQELDALQRAYEQAAANLRNQERLAQIDLEQRLREDARRSQEGNPGGSHP